MSKYSTKRSPSSSSVSLPEKVIPPQPPWISEQDEFRAKRNSDRYASIWDYNTQVSGRVFLADVKGGSRHGSMNSLSTGGEHWSTNTTDLGDIISETHEAQSRFAKNDHC